MKKKYNKIKPGEVFAFKGYRWIKLEDAGLCVMENILEEKSFDKEHNNWRMSELREYLNDDFYETLIENGANEKDFLMIETNLIADDGMKEYAISKDIISLMTADLYRRNMHLLKPLECWWWLATPHSCQAQYAHSVRCVNSSNTLGSLSVYCDYYGVRPLCNLSSETLVSMPEEENVTENDIMELITKWVSKDSELDKADSKAQMMYLLEALGDLAYELNRERQERITYNIGNIYISLTILAMQLGLNIKDCIITAYEEIIDSE